MKKGGFSAFPPIPPFGACSVGRLFAFSHIESHFRPLAWDASKSVPHKPCFSVIYVGRSYRFSHRNGQNRGLVWDFAFSGLRRRAAAMWEHRPAPAARGMENVACTKDCIPLFPGRVSAPSHPLDGRETAVPPAEQARSAQRRRGGMQFASRIRTAKPKAEVCGPAFIPTPGK